MKDSPQRGYEPQRAIMPRQDVSNIHLGNDLASGSALYRDSRSYDIHESEADEIGEHIDERVVGS